MDSHLRSAQSSKYVANIQATSQDFAESFLFPPNRFYSAPRSRP